VRLRRHVREEWAAGPDLESTLLPALAAWLGIPVLRLTGLLGARYFETAWAEIEAASPRLRQRVRLPLEALAIETASGSATGSGAQQVKPVRRFSTLQNRRKSDRGDEALGCGITGRRIISGQDTVHQQHMAVWLEASARAARSA
jgi:hypothetical protein